MRLAKVRENNLKLSAMLANEKKEKDTLNLLVVGKQQEIDKLKNDKEKYRQERDKAKRQLT